MVDESPAPGSSSSSSFAYGEFTPVKSRKNRKNNKKIKARPSPLLSLQRNREELRKGNDPSIGSSPVDSAGASNSGGAGGNWFSQCSQTISKVWHDHRSPSTGNMEGASSSSSVQAECYDVLCLGLGSPSESPNANAQLAFLLEICQDLSIANERIAVYDPVFTEEDLLLFKELRLQVLTENKKGAYPLASPTLCFMLHCDKELYEAILKANWNEDRIHRLVLIGNSLIDYLDRYDGPRAPSSLSVSRHTTAYSLDLSSSFDFPSVYATTQSMEFAIRNPIGLPSPVHCALLLRCEPPITLFNSLCDDTSNPSRALKDAVPHLFRIAPHLESQPLSPSRTWPTAFNNTCVQVYRKTTSNAPSNANPLSHERDEGEASDYDIFANGDPDVDDPTPTANPLQPHPGPVQEPTANDTNATPP